LDLPKYESLNTQVLGVSTDVVEALHAFAEKLSLTYPLLSDFSRETVKQYGMMVDDPHAASFRLAQRAYVVIDRHGIIRYKQIMEDPDHARHGDFHYRPAHRERHPVIFASRRIAELPPVERLFGRCVVCIRECNAASCPIAANGRACGRDGVANPHRRSSSRHADGGSTRVRSR
jgi:hypothetical protein